MLSKFVNWFKASVVIPMLFFNYCYADVEAESQINVTDSKFIEVQAEGIGESKINALKNAWSEAVRQAVGVYLISDEKVIDDDKYKDYKTINNFIVLKIGGGYSDLMNNLTYSKHNDYILYLHFLFFQQP